MTKIDIINETVAFYSADVKRRSLNEKEDCSYNGKNGTHCAVGRCLLPIYHDLGDKLPSNDWDFEGLFTANKCKDHNEMLQEQYRGHDLFFWNSLQSLHDTKNYWDAIGLTVAGEQYLQQLLDLNKN